VALGSSYCIPVVFSMILGSSQLGSATQSVLKIAWDASQLPWFPHTGDANLDAKLTVPGEILEHGACSSRSCL
jgi:hypothetical protein